MLNNSEQFQPFSLPALYSFQLEFMLTYGLVFILILISLYFFLPTISLKYNIYINNKLIKNLGKFQLNNVAIKINEYEMVYIDYLILIPTGILVLNVLKYNGIIFAGTNLEQWTQLLNKRSYKFPNPLHDLEIAESAVKGVISDCNIIGHIAFESNCQFPKGKPDKISLLHEMQEELEFLKGDSNGDLEAKWKALKDSDMCNNKIKQADLSILVKGEQKSIKKALGIFFFVLSLLLLLYQLSEQQIV